ncbi:nectin-1-like [Chelmon rostratus]|uniref:nectin-1-like n=1 Tax=Chelmon rostratus TaxID=109905 RepID=UPI001BE8B1B1|nr:nectin-1-like [Chelmon rostratus]
MGIVLFKEHYFGFLASLILSTVAEALQVTGGNVTVALGETCVLPCKLTGTTETLSQISWQRVTRGEPQRENFLTIAPKTGLTPVNGYDRRFTFIGNMRDGDGSLQLSGVNLMDEGVYICIFTLFPSGNHKTEIPLNLFVPPVLSLEDHRPALGSEEVALVTCTAAGSKPPAEVKWLTGTLTGKVRTTNSSTEHPNGTTTTVSSLFGVPTSEINQHLVHCVITSAALMKKESLPFTIQVYWTVRDDLWNILVFKGESVQFTCNTSDANIRKISWTKVGRTKGRLFFFHSISENLTFSNWTSHRLIIDRNLPPKLNIFNAEHDDAGLYTCTVTGAAGEVTFQWNLTVSEKPEEISPSWILQYILAPVIGLLLCAVAPAVCLCRKRRQTRTESGEGL